MKQSLTSMTLAFGIIVMTSLCYASQGASLLNGLNKPNDAPIQVADPAAGAGKLLAMLPLALTGKAWGCHDDDLSGNTCRAQQPGNPVLAKTTEPEPDGCEEIFS